MTSNPFATFGEALAPTKKPHRKARDATRQDKEQQDRERLSQEHRRWRKQAINALLNGPLGTAARELCDFLDHMQSDERGLIELVQSGPWRDADADTRFLILTLVDAAVTQLRERAGLVPFDDPLRDEESNVFLAIRKLLQ